MGNSHTISIIDSLEDLPAAQWDALAGANPFLSHAFLSALERNGCVGAEAGWAPCHVVMRRRGTLTGAMPLYLKSHSYGEYVFDWAWAEAYHRRGLRYYPKLLSAVPFTPVTGPRLMSADATGRRVLIDAALQFARSNDISSLHCLFPIDAEVESLRQAGTMIRRSVQFHWHNLGFSDFDDFLARMNHDKRKKIRQERRRLRDSAITIERIEGSEVTDADLRFFYDCYRRTYRQHMSTPYLNLEFFRDIVRAMPQQILLVVARRENSRIAAALDVRGPEALYGRYWGATEYHPGLHFEICYYQAIEHCIAHGIGRFEGGAQGEHKLARGLLPATTVSAHWLARPEFASAVADFLRRESRGIEHYVDELSDHSPFKRPGGEMAGG